MSAELLVNAAVLGTSVGIGIEIGLILATFAVDFRHKIRDETSLQRRAWLWARVYPHYVRRRFSPDFVPMLTMTALFGAVGSTLAVVLTLAAIGALEVFG